MENPIVLIPGLKIEPLRVYYCLKSMLVTLSLRSICCQLVLLGLPQCLVLRRYLLRAGHVIDKHMLQLLLGFLRLA